MKTARALLRFSVFILTISFYIGWCLLNKIFFKNYLERNKKVRSRWIRLIVPILGFEAEVEGEMPQETSLVIANHRSFSDPLIMLDHMDAFPLAKAEVNQYPFIGVGARATGILYVVRHNQDSRSSARQSIKETLQGGQNVLVYPEGTTSNETSTLPFKRGSLQVAQELGLLVVPVAIEYENRAHHWVDRSLWEQYVLQFGQRRCRCKIKIGDPIEPLGDDYGVSEVRSWIETQIGVMRNEYDGGVS